MLGSVCWVTFFIFSFLFFFLATELYLFCYLMYEVVAQAFRFLVAMAMAAVTGRLEAPVLANKKKDINKTKTN